MKSVFMGKNVAQWLMKSIEQIVVRISSKVGCLPVTSSEAGCPFSKGFRVGEPPFSLGKANLEGDRASKSLVLSNYILDPSRFGSEELGIQGGDEGDRVVCARDT